MHRSSLHAHVTARGRRERQTAGFVRVEASVGEDGRGLASTSATPLSSARTIARSALPHWAPRRAHRRRRAAVAHWGRARHDAPQASGGGVGRHQPPDGQKNVGAEQRGPGTDAAATRPGPN